MISTETQGQLRHHRYVETTWKALQQPFRWNITSWEVFTARRHWDMQRPPHSSDVWWPQTAGSLSSRILATIYACAVHGLWISAWFIDFKSTYTFWTTLVLYEIGFAVRVSSAGQKYGPTCHQRDRADVTEFVTLVRLSSLGQHVGILALARYKRRKSALTAGPILNNICTKYQMNHLLVVFG